jgi:hypothetical protein
MGRVDNGKGVYVPVQSLTIPAHKVVKLPNILEKALQQSAPDNAVVGNKKIMNATKVEAGGIRFDSRLEKTMYDLLTGAGIYFEFQKVFLLQEKFRYNGEAVRAITLTVDFYLPIYNKIIDTKGHQTQQGALRYKLLKSVLKHLYDMQPEVLMPKNALECERILNRLLYNETQPNKK